MIKEALSGPDGGNSRREVDEQLEGLGDKDTFISESPSLDSKPVKIRFVFKIKLTGDRIVARYTNRAK